MKQRRQNYLHHDYKNMILLVQMWTHFITSEVYTATKYETGSFVLSGISVGNKTPMFHGSFSSLLPG
jgi:hypothetical protein